MMTKQIYTHPRVVVIKLSTTYRRPICLTTSGNFETTQDEAEEEW